VSSNRGSNRPGWLWTPDDTDIEDQPADFNAGLASLAFIRAAIRRSAWFCGAMAVAGMLIGAGLYLKSPPIYQASTTLILTNGPEVAPGAALSDDQVIAQSRPVAALALHMLGLRQSVSSFLGSYTATPLTDRVLLVTVNASSSGEAVRQANALATAFLSFRARQLETQQSTLFKTLDQQVTQAKQQITSLSRQIGQVTAQPASAAQQAKLSSLRAERGRAAAALTGLEQSVNTTRASTQETTASQIKNSQVLNVAAAIPPHSRSKHALFYAVFGLIGGLVLSLGIVVVRALISDRLLRRDDVARALGAPVKLSIGKVRLSRWRPGRRGLAAAEDAGIRRIVAHLHSTAVANSRGTPALAVVSIGDPQVSAISLVSLAISFAEQMGLRVVMADLCSTTPAAHLLGVTEPGIHTVRTNGGRLVVAIPDRDDVTPVGPVTPVTAHEQFPPCGRELAAAFAAADVMLTLAALDPSVGAEHLATWAPVAVAMVTAGKSSWTSIHAASEMIRLSGTRLVSAVLVGADKTDESLGVASTPGASDHARDAEDGLPDTERFFATLDKGPGVGRPDDR
jgi:capsular polysaccharide biosynthesis protein